MQSAAKEVKRAVTKYEWYKAHGICPTCGCRDCLLYTSQRAVREKIPPETLCFTREGPREWWTLYSPYIARRYGNMVSLSLIHI